MNYYIRNNYQELGNEFINHYYNNFDNSFFELVNVFENDSKFTFLDDEVIGFHNFYNLLVNKHCFTSVNHIIDKIKTQPLGDKTLIIQVNGRISVNNQEYLHFAETFVLQYKFSTNTFSVHSNIFSLI